MRRKTSRRTRAATLATERGRATLLSTRRLGFLGNGRGFAKINGALLRTGKRKAKKAYIAVKEHPLRSIGLVTLGMGIISTLYLLQHRHSNH